MAPVCALYPRLAKLNDTAWMVLALAVPLAEGIVVHTYYAGKVESLRITFAAGQGNTGNVGTTKKPSTSHTESHSSNEIDKRRGLGTKIPDYSSGWPSKYRRYVPCRARRPCPVA